MPRGPLLRSGRANDREGEKHGGIKEKGGREGGRKTGEEGAGAGMKCPAIKLSELFTFSYKGAYLSWNGCLCSAPHAHKCRLMDENAAIYI